VQDLTLQVAAASNEMAVDEVGRHRRPFGEWPRVDDRPQQDGLVTPARAACSPKSSTSVCRGRAPVRSLPAATLGRMPGDCHARVVPQSGEGCRVGSPHVFGLCAALGFRFAPRIRDVLDQRLRHRSAGAGLRSVQQLLTDRINTRVVTENWDEVLRVEKTIFILELLLDPQLRHRQERGLNAGEAVNSASRAIFVGQRGEFRDRAY
jgi:hypothetical protein